MLKPNVCVDVRDASEEDIRAVVDKCVSLGAYRSPPSGATMFIYWYGDTVGFFNVNNRRFPVITVDQALGRDDKHGWHKRGEFPPVGTECEYFWDSRRDEWRKVVIICAGLDEESECVALKQGKQLRISTNPKHFRPINAERDKFIERYSKEFPALSEYAGDMYDSGVRYIN